MKIGYMGDVVFEVSPSHLLTPSDYERTSAGRWAEHDLVLRKPVSQFGGPGLEKVTFNIFLDTEHGLDVGEQLKKLRKMRDLGAVFPLVIGGEPVTQSYWRLDSIKESGHYWTNEGKLQQCIVAIELTEYEDSNTVEENSIDTKQGRERYDGDVVQGGGAT